MFRGRRYRPGGPRPSRRRPAVGPRPAGPVDVRLGNLELEARVRREEEAPFDARMKRAISGMVSLSWWRDLVRDGARTERVLDVDVQFQAVADEGAVHCAWATPDPAARGRPSITLATLYVPAAWRPAA